MNYDKDTKQLLNYWEQTFLNFDFPFRENVIFDEDGNEICEDEIFVLAPFHLGFVIENVWLPNCMLSHAGHKLLTSRRTDEVFLRQMLKFQVPSPYHKPTDKVAQLQ